MIHHEAQDKVTWTPITDGYIFPVPPFRQVMLCPWRSWRSDVDRPASSERRACVRKLRRAYRWPGYMNPVDASAASLPKCPATLRKIACNERRHVWAHCLPHGHHVSPRSCGCADHARGYIGGTVFKYLTQSAAPPQHIIAPTRNASKIATLKAMNLNSPTVEPIQAGLDDHDALVEASSRADVVISTADSDHVPGIKALIAGAEKFKARTGKTPILIHTSGCGVLIDEADGMFCGDKVSTLHDGASADTRSTPICKMASLQQRGIQPCCRWTLSLIMLSIGPSIS